MNRKIIEYGATALAVLAALALLGWFVLLPATLGTILPGLVNGAQDGVRLRSCSVRLVGLGGASLHGVVLSVPDVAELELGQMDVTYSLAGLSAGQVREVRVSDVLLELTQAEKQETTQASPPEEADAEGLALALPPLDRLVVSSGQLRLTRGGTVHSIPFSLDYTAAQGRDGGEVSLLASPLGASLSAQASLRLPGPGDTAMDPSETKPMDSPEANEPRQGLRVQAHLEGLALQRLFALLDIPMQGRTLHGQASATASGGYNLDSRSFRLDQCAVAIADLVLMDQGRPLASGQGLRASIHQGTAGDFPFELEMQSLHGFGGNATLQAAGRLTGGATPTLEADYVLARTEEAFALKARLSGTAKAGLTPDGWTADTAGDITGVLRLGQDATPETVENIAPNTTPSGTAGLTPNEARDQTPSIGSASGPNITLGKASYTLNARGNGSQGTLDWTLLLAPQHLLHSGMTVTTKALQASGTLSGSLSTAIAGTMQADLSGVRLTGNGVQAQADLSLRGMVRALPQPGASVTLQGRNISVSAKDAQLSKAALSLPLTYPPAQGGPGSLTIQDIRAMGRQWGRLGLNLRQDNRQLLLDGTYLGALFPGLKAGITARLSPGAESPLEAQIKVEDYVLPAGFKLAQLSPALGKVTASGRVSVLAALRVEPSGLSATGHIQLIDGSLQDAELDAHMDGITLSLDLPDLLALRSDPLQTATFASLRYKDIAISDGRLQFQLDGPQRLLTTGARFNWLGGVVQALPFQIVSGRSDYDLILYCSNLGITELLRQLGFAQASGKGEISGKIPVRIKDGQLSFDAAQLQSSPESGGVIRVKQAEALLAGVDPGSAQYAQMKIASEALKNFEYKWAKVTASSEGETLKVKLQLDGQPAENLPFEYSKDYGLIALQTTGQGMKFQGIRLDVNFSLPLDRMLRLRELFGQE